MFVSVCLLAYLRNQTAELHQCFAHVVGSFSDGVVIRYVLLVLWMNYVFTQWFHGALRVKSLQPKLLHRFRPSI